MKKHARLWIIVTIIVAIGLATLYVVARPQTASMPITKDPAAQKEVPNDSVEQSPTPTAALAKGTYTAYTESTFATAPADRRVLFFHAPWCPQCRELDEDLNTEPLPYGVTIFKADYDSNQDLRKKYGVTLQTTFVEVDGDGNKIASYVAYETPQFAAVKNALKL
jgi:thiol-disulfide isomerase/thioredoxin